jgi:ribosomal protein S18 acetylase RimI-like enzyme
VRAARVEDAPLIAEVIAMAIGDKEALRNYCGEEYMSVLTTIASREATQYSWQNALVAEVEGVAAGAVVGYDGAELYSLREGTFNILMESVGRVPTIIDETEAGEYYLDSVGVLPAFRNHGVGRALVSAFCKKVFNEGHARVGLIVEEENDTAEKLYTALGFERVGTKLFFGHTMKHLQRHASALQNYSIIEVSERTELDEEGRPFPLLYMCLEK